MRCGLFLILVLLISQLRTANEQLHQTVAEKTANLTAELAERKRVEEELRKSEGKFRAIFDNTSDGMFLVDLKARKFFMCNATCARMLGYTQEEFSNLDIADIHPGRTCLLYTSRSGSLAEERRVFVVTLDSNEKTEVFL